MPKYNVLMIKEGDRWVAQCLEHDIAAQGKNMRDAAYELQKTFLSELAVCEELGYNFPGTISKAPDYYWKMFDCCGETVSSIPAQMVFQGTSSTEVSFGEVRAA